MGIALYSAAVSLLYVAVAVVDPETAATLVVAFVALLLVPACWKRAREDRAHRPPRP